LLAGRESGIHVDWGQVGVVMPHAKNAGHAHLVKVLLRSWDVRWLLDKVGLGGW
jgi:hypothetical protein